MLFWLYLIIFLKDDTCMRAFGPKFIQMREGKKRQHDFGWDQLEIHKYTFSPRKIYSLFSFKIDGNTILSLWLRYML